MELQIAKNGETMEDSKGKIKVNLFATTKASYTLWQNPWLDVWVTKIYLHKAVSVCVCVCVCHKVCLQSKKRSTEHAHWSMYFEACVLTLTRWSTPIEIYVLPKHNAAKDFLHPIQIQVKV